MSRVDTQQKRRRPQKARGFKRFIPTVAASEMVAETAARERRDPSPPPTVEGGIETPSSADDILKTSISALATAPPSGGAATRTSTHTPVVALPPGGEAPAAPEDVETVGAANEKVEMGLSECGGRMRLGAVGRWRD